MSLLFFIIVMMVVGVFYVRRKARRMFANINEQMDPYRETFDKATKKTKVDGKQVFDGQFEEVRTTKEN
jgi:hypothetical protein